MKNVNHTSVLYEVKKHLRPELFPEVHKERKKTKIIIISSIFYQVIYGKKILDQKTTTTIVTSI